MTRLALVKELRLAGSLSAGQRACLLPLQLGPCRAGGGPGAGSSGSATAAPGVVEGSCADDDQGAEDDERDVASVSVGGCHDDEGELACHLSWSLGDVPGQGDPGCGGGEEERGAGGDRGGAGKGEGRAAAGERGPGEAGGGLERQVGDD